MPNRLIVVLTVVLAMAGATVPAVTLPVSAHAGGPVSGDQNSVTPPTTPDVQVTSDGDIVLRSTVAAVTVATSARHAEAQFAAAKWLRTRILHSQQLVTQWSQVMGVRAPALNPRRLASLGLDSLKQVAWHWEQKARITSFRAHHPPHLTQFLCIHSHEGSWTDTGGPYYGGIQFGFNEWRKYGYPYTHKAYANQASPLQQIWSGERYWRESGFHPWPQTAAMCRLL